MSSISIVIGGLGARGILFHTSYVAKAIARIWSAEAEAEGEPQKSRVHDFYDFQSSAEGPGNAFQIECDGCLNTGLPGPIELGIDGLSAKQISTLNRLTDLAGRYTELIMGSDPCLTLDELQNRNVNSAICFAQAIKTGELDTSEACGPRRLIGEALNAMRDEATQLASQYLPWLRINIHHGVEIIHVNIDDPVHPQLHVLTHATGRVEVLPPCDMFIKATGTTWKIPVQGQEQQHAYTLIANAEKSREYIARLGWLEDDSIQPGLRLLIGGTSLSALDHVGIIIAMTSIVEIDKNLPHGFEVNEREALKYKSLITFFNRTEGDVCPVRHDTTTCAAQDSTLITSEMLLAARLQRDQDPVNTYMELARIQTGVHFNKLPSEVNNLTSFETVFRQIESDIAQGDECVASESSTFQNLTISMIMSCTAIPGDSQSMTDMKAQFPLLLRNPLEDFRAMSHIATHSKDITWKQNEGFSRAIRNVTNYLAAAPRATMLLVAQLVRLGVITWEKLSYEDLVWNSDEACYKAKGDSFHGLFASRLYTVETDKIWDKLQDQLPPKPPGHAMFKKGRFLYNGAGEVVHIIDLGLSGHGKRSGSNLVHAQWHDTNTYVAVHQLMPSMADLVTLFESALSKDIKQPVEWLYELESRSRPSLDGFRQQTDMLCRPYNDLVRYLATARALAAMSTNGCAFAAAMKKIKCIDDCWQVEDASKRAGDAVGEQLATFSDFDPMDGLEFENVFADFRADRLTNIRNELRL